MTRWSCCVPITALGIFRGGRVRIVYWLHGPNCPASLHRRATLAKREAA